MGLTCYILLLDVLLLGCRCVGADDVVDEAGISEASNVSTDDSAHSAVAQLQELRVPDQSEDGFVPDPGSVQPTFTLRPQSSNAVDMSVEGGPTTPFPSQDLFKEEMASGTNTSSTRDTTADIHFPEPPPGQSSSSPNGRATLTEAPSLEMQENPAEPEVPVEAAPAQEQAQQAVPDSKKGDADGADASTDAPAVATHPPGGAAGKVSSEDEKSQAAEKMPTFAEWKEKMLAVQEKGADQLPDAPGMQQKKKTSKGGRNYASYECGAKVLANNPEADGAGRVLNEMLDEYMLNPCKAKIWFIIELCETIQVSQLEIANFELFSSMPKDFSVAVSDRYPTREWTQIGVFTALNQKAVQSFKLQSDGYGKYIKVELLSRYGSEHYCPLSLFRVYGTSMLEDYEQLEDKPNAPSQQNSEEEDEDKADKAEKSKNVVDRAKDAVLSILKVLRRDQEDSNTVGNISCSEDDRNCGNITNTSASVVNLSHELQCHPRGAVAPAFQPCVVCSQAHHVASNSVAHSRASSVCHFLRTALMPANECPHDSPQPPVGDQLAQSSRDDPSTTRSSATSATSYASSSESPTGGASGSSESSQSSQSSSVPTSSEQKWVQATSSSSEQSLREESSVTQVSEVSNVTTSAPISKEESTTTSSLQGSIISEGIASDMITPTPIIVSSPTDIETSPGGSQTTRTEATSESTSATGDVPPVTIVVGEDGSAVPQHSADSVDEGDVVAAADGTLKEGGGGGKATELGSASGSQKESVFMRINNRIKVLELNMSLSSQYLEELSQRYRKQMEDMQRNFNRTISALNETTRMAAERDQRQQEALIQLQQQLANLTKTVDTLLAERRAITGEVFQSHVCFVVVEAIVLAAVFSLCLKRSHSLEQRTRDRHERHSSRTSLKRRSAESEPCSPAAQVVIAEKKQKPSEDSTDSGSRVVIVEPVVPILMESQPKEKAKKHKNKRHKGSKRKGSVPDTRPDSRGQQGVNKDMVDKDTSAGVLFSSTSTANTTVKARVSHSAPTRVPRAVCITSAPSVPVQVVTHKWKDSKAYGLCSQDSKLGLMKIFSHAGRTPV